MKAVMAPHVAERLAEVRRCVENDGGQLFVVSVCQNTGSVLCLILPPDTTEQPQPLVIDSIESFLHDSVLH